jgi:hypothetical protein
MALLLSSGKCMKHILLGPLGGVNLYPQKTTAVRVSVYSVVHPHGISKKMFQV